jgi:hypothetical protein
MSWLLLASHGQNEPPNDTEKCGERNEGCGERNDQIGTGNSNRRGPAWHGPSKNRCVTITRHESRFCFDYAREAFHLNAFDSRASPFRDRDNSFRA